jgi:DNA-binding NtrC family response regulator
VLIEEPDGAEAFAYWHLLTDKGYSVQWCPGPGGPTRGRCALVSTGQCQLVEEADVVVSALGIDHKSSRDVLGAIRRLHPETPVVIQASRREFSRWADLFDGESDLRIPVTGRALLDSVEGAVAHR